VELAVPVAIGVTVIIVMGLMFAKLYKRSTRDEAYVRTPRRAEGRPRRRFDRASDLPFTAAVI